MRVGFDLDGVLYDFGGSVRRYHDYIGRPYGFKGGEPEPHTWNFFKYWKMDSSEFVQICHDGVDAGFIFQGPTRQNAVEAMRAVKEMGHTVVIITDRQFGSSPEKSHLATRQWLEFHEFPYDELVFSADKTIVPTDVFVEDKLENYDLITTNGGLCYLITRPWNKRNDKRRRIEDISDYPALVAEVARERDDNRVLTMV
jgi:5'(3')-deoxyribonucleotidase